MRRSITGAVIAIALSMPVWAAQEIKFPVDLDNLAERATESVNVTLDSSMLQLAGGFLSKDDSDQAQAKKLISKLKGIYVRSFEFDKEGQYSARDVESIREQLQRPEWSRIVDVKSAHKENTEIYVKKNGNQVAGLVVLDAEPKELTIVDIDGAIDPQELSELGGHMGIPKFDKNGKLSKTDDKARTEH